MSRLESLHRRTLVRPALLAGVIALVAGVAACITPAGAVAAIGPVPATQHAVTISVSPVTGLANGQAITFTVNTAGGTTLIGNISAHICIHGSTTYDTSTYGYDGQFVSRCVYSTGIVSGGLTGGDYEKLYEPAYSGTQTTSGPLTFHAGTGTVTWGTDDGFGPFTLTANATHEVDLVVQVNLSGDTTAQTYFIQPLTFGNAPGAPTSPTAKVGNASAALSWHAPTSTGGSPITGYVVTPFIGATAQAAQTFNSTATSETATGLTNGATYTFKIAAKNAVGTGAQSAATAAITIGVPKVPTVQKATPRSTSGGVTPIAVFYTAGANDGSAITKFTATCTSSNGGVSGHASFNGSTATTIVVNGLTLKKTYTCTVTATNANGTSHPSDASNSVVVGAPAQVAQPSISKTSTGHLKVSFTNLTGTQTNGAALSTPDYTASCKSSNGGVTKSATGTHSAITVSGLSGGKSYTCTVQAHNSRGYGRPSPASASHTA